METRDILISCGFQIPPLIDLGRFSPEKLVQLRDGESKYSSLSPREGVYLKSFDGTCRYKMVSPWFKSDDDWNKKPLVTNRLTKTGKIIR